MDRARQRDNLPFLGLTGPFGLLQRRLKTSPDGLSLEVSYGLFRGHPHSLLSHGFFPLSRFDHRVKSLRPGFHIQYPQVTVPLP